MNQENKKISIVLTFYNAEDTLLELHSRVFSVLKKINYDYEIIYVNDSSDDSSEKIILDFINSDNKVKLINTTRRFGVQEGLLAGLEHATGNCAIFLDTDLQDPPELIEEMVKKWEEGFQVVNTVRTKREGENFLKLFFTFLSYRLISKLSDFHVPVDCGDFKLIDQKVLSFIKNNADVPVYVKSLIYEAGWSSTSIKYKRESSKKNVSNFGLGILHPQVLKGFVSFLYTTTNKHLFILAASCFILSFVNLIYSFIYLFFLEKIFSTFLILLSLSLILCLFGGISILLIKIYSIVRKKNNYFIKEKIGFK